MSRRALPALLLGVVWCLVSAPARAEVTIEPRGSRVDLSAKAAPLSEVLDRLARQIGMKVEYQGAAPRQAVTLTLHDRSPVEAVLALLEGQGINFALVSDEADGRVRTLILAGRTSAAATSASSPRPAPRPTFQPAVDSDPFDPEPDMAEPPSDEPPVAPPPEAVGPGQRRPSTADPPPQEAPAGQTSPAAPPTTQQEWPVSPFMPQPPAPPVPAPAPGQPQTQPGPPPPGTSATAP